MPHRLAQRQISLVLALSRVCDTAHDERELSLSFVDVVAKALSADLCLICLPDEDDGALAIRALVDRFQITRRVPDSRLRELAAQAATISTATYLDLDTTDGHGRLHFLAAPLRIGDDRLGSMLLVNTTRDFDDEDYSLLAVAIVEIDSALQHARTVNQLQQRTVVLETVFRIDRIRDSAVDFQSMLDRVLAELCGAVPAEAGFIMLYDSSGRELELRAVTDRDLFALAECQRAIRRAADLAVQRAEPFAQTYPGGPVHSMIGLPLILRERLIGVLGLVNRRERAAFGNYDRTLLSAIASQIDTAIFESLETQRLREAFGRSVGPRVMDKLLAISDRDLLRGERVEVTTLFSDIRGFTAVSEGMDPTALEWMINEHLAAMTDVVLAYEATLDKYVGDCVMAFFNAPVRQADHAVRAVRLALEMQAAHRRVMRRWAERGLEARPIGIGIATGEVVVGNFGSEQRSDYSILGADVNLASRLCAAAEGDQTLISLKTYELVKGDFVTEPLPPMPLKGIAEPVPMWQVLGVK